MKQEIILTPYIRLQNMGIWSMRALRRSRSQITCPALYLALEQGLLQGRIFWLRHAPKDW